MSAVPGRPQGELRDAQQGSYLTGTSARRGWIQMAAVVTLLVSALVILYAKTQSYGVSDYFENVAVLRHVKQLDAQWELDALKSRIGISTNYDTLSDSLTELSALVEKLDADTGAQRHGEPADLARGSAALRRVIEEKAALIEQFKSHNAVLRNSLVFLPTAAEEARQAIMSVGDNTNAAAPRTLARLHDLLLDSLLFSQNASSDMGVEIQNKLYDLDADLHVFPADIRERLEIFGAHVRSILREQKLVDELLSRVAATQTANRIDEINNTLSSEQRGAQAQSQRYRGYLLAFSGALLGLLLYAAVQLLRSHAVIKRVNRELQGANENLEQRVQERTSELRQTQTELVATARMAGMAEIATNVLHNVGNVLNSVNVSAGLVSTRLRTSKLKGLARATGLMDEHAADLGHYLTQDTRGKLLPAYLRELAPALEGEHAAMAQELAALGKSVDHIKEVIATQQSYAGAARLVESVLVSELVDDALRMNTGSLARHKVEIVKDIAALPALPLDRHRLLQILVNLISNAKQAMDSVTDRNHCITLRAAMADGGMLRLTVADNGEGIAPENLTRMFSHGFTTRATGHGFGLHSCVVAAQEMGGSLSAHSDGPGRGATFTLDIPTVAAKGKL